MAVGSTSDGVSGVLPPPVRGIALSDWRELIDHGRRRGRLLAEEIVDVLHHVELSAELIDVVRRAIEDHGVAVEQSFDLDESGELRRPLIESGIEPPTEGRRRRRSNRTASIEGPDQDAVRLYMYEISQIPLLDAEGERHLARQIEAGHEAQRVLRAHEHQDGASDGAVDTELSFAERRSLQRAAAAGERARQQLITSNLRLVVSIAKRFVRPNMPLADAIQSGNIGLMKAVEKFDHSRGFKFSTYATWWIRQSISRAVAEESRNIRLPAHTVEHIQRIQRTQRDLMQKLQREPTIAEIAAALGDDIDRVAELLHFAADTTSLDQPARDDTDLTVGDNVAADVSSDPTDSIERDVLREAVRLALGDLPEREQEVMRMRFGIDCDEGATLEEVGQAFNITRERVRQIEVRTLTRLRHMAGGRALRDFVQG
ncbi:MAG: RNA polymerase subunit sigma-70 [Acidimicrobiales bacterium mtb01]|nr:sigma-70 family RNA polymerase sigma factor [Actinomycetota bacterium]TEX44898.1 MAG: RNA polymerase subunit sigma-70 [Acidimicrobiales bacterium mtb01]